MMVCVRIMRPQRRAAVTLRFAVFYFLHSFALGGERIPDLRHFQQLLAVIFFLYGTCHRAAFGSVLPEFSGFTHPQVGPPCPYPPRVAYNLNFYPKTVKSYG